LIAGHLAQGKLQLLAPHGWLQPKQKYISLQDLAGQAMVGLEGQDPLSPALENKLQALRPAPSIQTRVQTHQMMRSMVEAGEGLAIVDPFTALGARSAGLDVCPLSPAVPISLYALTFKHAAPSAAIQTLLPSSRNKPRRCCRAERVFQRIIEQSIPEQRHFGGVRINAAITQLVNAANHVAAALIQPTGAKVVVLGFEHDPRQLFLATPELRDIQQCLGHTMPASRRVHRQLINMRKAVPVGADHQMTDRLIVEIGHENRAVGALWKAAELLGIDAVALAVRHDRRHPPLFDRLANHGGAIGRNFETEVAAPDIRRKAFIGDPHRQPGYFGFMTGCILGKVLIP
jgi:hypothetical protein